MRGLQAGTTRPNRSSGRPPPTLSSTRCAVVKNWLGRPTSGIETESARDQTRPCKAGAATSVQKPNQETGSSFTKHYNLRVIACDQYQIHELRVAGKTGARI